MPRQRIRIVILASFFGFCAGLFCSFAQTGIILTNLVYFNGTNGKYPTSLIQTADASFYGTTRQGGSSGYGTVFKMTPSGGLTTLVNFVDTNGVAPLSALMQGTDGNLYGTTQLGGNGYGTAFGITTNGAFTCQVSFAGTNGSVLFAGLVQGLDGNLYGTTADGGSQERGDVPGDGNVFEMTTAGVLTNLHNFAGSNNSTNTGISPNGRLVQGNDGDFYGATLWTKSTSDYGTLYKVDTNGNATTLFIFNNSDGAQPVGSLTLGNDGNFYGFTQNGGSNNCGTLFKFGTNGALTSLFSFNGTNGFGTYAPLVDDDQYGSLCQASDGNFYGETMAGGPAYPIGYGTIFRITPNGGFASLFSFGNDAGDGYYPAGGLIQATDGNFYGVTYSGGTNDDGVIFRLTVPLQPVFQSASQTSGVMTLNWSTVASESYQLQYTTNLGSVTWNDLGNATVATNGIMSATDVNGADDQKFYRVVLTQ